GSPRGSAQDLSTPSASSRRSKWCWGLRCSCSTKLGPPTPRACARARGGRAESRVAWWLWCDDAFAEAAERGVPVFLSVGYAACHWCHVMAHESFEDTQTAFVINEHFVPIKVDREERPDVDAVYMQATQALTGQGGWPMTVFLTPDRQPFYAGTYF